MTRRKHTKRNPGTFHARTRHTKRNPGDTALGLLALGGVGLLAWKSGVFSGLSSSASTTGSTTGTTTGTNGAAA